MSKVRCSLRYKKSKLSALPTFAGGVRDGVYGNPTTFIAPPLGSSAFQALITAYSNTRSAYKQGGLAQKAPFKQARGALLEALDSTARYVDTVASGEVNIITLAGFEPTKTTTGKRQPPKTPTGISIKRGNTGVLLVQCNKQDTAVAYGCIMTANDPLPSNVVMNGVGQLVVSESGKHVGDKKTAISASDGSIPGTLDLNTSRKKRFINLTPGVIYHFVFYAMNTRGVSPISPSVSIMCA